MLCKRRCSRFAASLPPSVTLGSQDLIAGFKPKLMPRSDGRYDLNFTGPDGKRFRSMLDVGRFFNLSEDDKEISHQLSGLTKVRDLWTRSEVGEYDDQLSISVPAHGAGLYQLTPCPSHLHAPSTERELADAETA